jgi:hypothetical protein
MNTLHNTSPEHKMKRSERLLRAFGGYALGFAGIAMQANGIGTLNPVSFAIGTGLAYLGHKVLDPYYDQQFGKPSHESSKLARFAKFNAGLVPTYIGATLLSGAIFNEAGRAVAERVAVGAFGAATLLVGGAVEHYAHNKESLLPPLEPMTDPVIIEATAQPQEQLQATGLFSRIKAAIHAFRGQQTATV